MEVAIQPAERRLDDPVQIGKRHRAWHEEPPPDRRIDADDRDLQLGNDRLVEGHAGMMSGSMAFGTPIHSDCRRRLKVERRLTVVSKFQSEDFLPLMRSRIGSLPTTTNPASSSIQLKRLFELV